MSVEKMIRDQYRFVVIRSFYNLRHNKYAISFFPKILKFKIDGYLKEYPNYVLPFDSSDFMATHLTLCRKKQNKEFTPVLGFKSISLKQCDEHRISMPIFSMLESTENTKYHVQTIQDIINDHRKNNTSNTIAYNGSFTIHPELRKDKDLMRQLWDITFSLLTNYYIDYNIDHVLALCATRYNVNLKKEKLGWNYIQGKNGPLGEYACNSLFGAYLIPMELTNIREKGLKSANKFKDMWKDRLHLELDRSSPIETAA